jgi:hypothetical protein
MSSVLIISKKYEIQEDEMGGECRTDRRNEKCINILVRNLK